MESTVVLNTPYLFKDMFPNVYKDMRYRALYLLKNDLKKVEDRLDNLKIVFNKDSVDKEGYDRETSFIRFRLPEYFFKNNWYNYDYDVKLEDIRKFVSNNYIARRFLVHEVMHSIQNLSNKQKSNKYDEYYKKFNDGEIEYDDNPYEKGAIVESLFDAKRRDVSLDDLKNSTKRNTWNELKIESKIFDGLDLIKSYYSFLENNKNIDEINTTIENIKMAKNIVINNIKKYLIDEGFVYKQDLSYEDSLKIFMQLFKQFNKNHLLSDAIDINQKYWTNNQWNIGYNRNEVEHDEVWSTIIVNMVKMANKLSNGLDSNGLYLVSNEIDDIVKRLIKCV